MDPVGAARSSRRRSPRLDLAAAAAVTALVGALTTAAAAHELYLWNDAIEYVAIANAWAHGAGFVDPVKWTYYLDTPAPFPAFALRSPLPAALMAIPLALGASLPLLRALGAALASLVIGGLVLLARRTMSLPAAVACGLMIGLSDPWLLISVMPMSDLIAIGAMLLVFATSVAASRSVGAGFRCSAVTLLGWATRPTIALLVVPIVLTVAWTEGVRSAARSRGLGVYLGTTLAGYLLIRQATTAITGFSPYAGYGFMSEMLTREAPLSYGTQYVGTSRFISTWLPQILDVALVRAQQLFAEIAVTPRFGHIGWLALPGVVYCLARRHPDPDQAALRRVVALSCLLFATLTILTYAAFDPNRYPLPAVVCGALCGFAWLDDMLVAAASVVRARLSWASTRRHERLVVGALLSLPLAFVVGGILQRGGLGLWPVAARNWSELIRGATPLPETDLGQARIRAICRRIPPGVVVAAPDPWRVHAWCGNPAVMLPIDLYDDSRRQRSFLARERASYVLYDGSHLPRARPDDPTPVDGWLASSPDVQRVATQGAMALYKVREPSPDRVAWQQPPPLLCAGRGESCRHAVGR
jgi:hypothetical protein